MSLGVDEDSACDEYYRVNIYSSGDSDMYLDESDYRFFLSLLNKYLLGNKSIEILVYCLEGDHSNLMLSQLQNGGIDKLLHNLTIDYNKYFFDKYKFEDLLFENNYAITKVPNGKLLEVSRYIHKSPGEWIDYPYSSIRAYFYDDVPEWLSKTCIANLYGSAVKYYEFMNEDKI